MAKGNLLLGTAGNSVGDVVMYRREGAQVSRVRVRKVKNPKTAAQSTQRAFFAPVAKFYSPLSIVLERSYEGLSKSKSYSKFLKTNVDLARQNDWLLPKGTGFFPLPYKLSSGSLPMVNYTMSSNTGFSISVPGIADAPTTIGALSQIFVNLGYSIGSIVTIICAFGTVPGGFYPKAWQFEIDVNSDTTIATALPGLTFSVPAPGSGSLAVSTGSTSNLAAVGLIVATFKNDVWRRSSQNFDVLSTILTDIAATNFKAAAIASYGATNTGDNPLVYLDGEELV